MLRDIVLDQIRHRETSEVPYTLTFEEEVGRVAKAAGLRGVLGETIIGFPVADARTPAEPARAPAAARRCAPPCPQ